jgi:sterol 3beta-glucosyltransferase
MKITILTIGSRGDIQPYIALGLALKKAGQQVQIATLENFETFITAFGLDFYPVQGDISSMMTSSVVNNARQVDNPLKFLRSFNQMKAYVFELQKDFFDACQGSDVIIYHPGAAIGYFTAQHLNIPSVLATPFPMTPTSDYPSLIFYNLPRFGKVYNRLTHKIFEKIMWMASSTPVKTFWKQKFGSKPKNFSCPFGKQTTKRLPTIISCSDTVFSRPTDWPEHVHNSGYWFLDDEPDWSPSADLEDFLNKGKPPVYVGFGSIADPALAIQTTDLVIEALRKAGQRGVLASGWQGMTIQGEIPDDIFLLESAPHAWLFPRMAAVVHHGGAGTTAAGLRAGVPSIVIPHTNDQFAWGRRAEELGVGSKPIPRKQLNAERLAAAIHDALKDDVQQAARTLGVKIQNENGAENAARIILESYQ